MILDLIDKYHPTLHTECLPFDFANPQCDPVELAKNLTETMISNNGLGLAAPQVGIPLRVFVLTGEKVLACFNPKIVDLSKEEVYINEGCLSYPGLYVKIKRPREVRVRFTMPNGSTETMKFDGLTSRCFQHEMDHLNGHNFMELATLYHKQQAFSQLKKYERSLKKTGAK